MAHKVHLHDERLSTRTDARTVRTREALRRALLQLLQTKPLDEISVRDIVAESGVGYATFFRHHPTKEALLNEVVAEQIERLLGATLPVLETGSSRDATVALCRYVDENRALWSALLEGGAAGALREQFLRISKRIADMLWQPGHWLPAEFASTLVVSGTIELLALWLRQDHPLPVEKIAEIHDRIVVSPTVNSEESGAWRTALASNKSLPRQTRKKAAAGKR